MPEPAVSPHLLRNDKEEPKLQLAGRPTSNSYLNADELIDPVAGQQFSSTVQHVYENYPFVGTLLQKKDNNYRITSTFTKTKPGTINDVEQIHGPGEYQIRFTDTNAEETTLSFSIKEEISQAPVATPTISFDSEQQQQRILRLESRIKERDEELDDNSRKIRTLNNELIEQERVIKARYDLELDRFRRENEELKQKNNDLDRKNFEMKLEAKLEGKDTQGILKYLEKAIENPALQGIASAIIDKLSAVSHPQLPAGRTNPEQSHNTELNDSEAMAPEQHAQTITQQVVDTIFSIGVNALSQQNPNGVDIKNGIQNALNTLSSQNLEFDKQNWIIIAKGLVQHKIANNIPTERLNAVIEPLLENIEVAKTTLKYSPVKVVMNIIENTFKMDLNDDERSVLADVLTLFKKKLS